MIDSKKDANEKAEQKRLDGELDKTILEIAQDKQNDVSERRIPGTGDWGKKEPLFQEWIAEEAPLL